jgi:hypothetical protein
MEISTNSQRLFSAQLKCVALGRRPQPGKSGSPGGGEFVTQGVIVAPLKAAFLSLALARFDQMLQASGSLRYWFTAFRAAAVPLHPQLVFPLPRNRQVGELIDNSVSHGIQVVVGNLQTRRRRPE